MAKRKVTKRDVNSAYEMADKAKESAMYSLQRARQLKDGADKLNAEYKRNRTAEKAAQTKTAKPAKPKTTAKKSKPGNNDTTSGGGFYFS